MSCCAMIKKVIKSEEEQEISYWKKNYFMVHLTFFFHFHFIFIWLLLRCGERERGGDDTTNWTRVFQLASTAPPPPPRSFRLVQQSTQSSCSTPSTFMFSLNSVVVDERERETEFSLSASRYYRSFEILRYCTPSATHLFTAAVRRALKLLRWKFQRFHIKTSHNRVFCLLATAERKKKALRCWFLNDGNGNAMRMTQQLTTDEWRAWQFFFVFTQFPFESPSSHFS